MRPSNDGVIILGLSRHRRTYSIQPRLTKETRTEDVMYTSYITDDVLYASHTRVLHTIVQQYILDLYLPGSRNWYPSRKWTLYVHTLPTHHNRIIVRMARTLLYSSGRKGPWVAKINLQQRSSQTGFKVSDKRDLDLNTNQDNKPCLILPKTWRVLRATTK